MSSHMQTSHLPLLSTPRCANSFALLMFFISAAAYATATGIVQLPDSYRTPLSDLIQEDNKNWRAVPEKDNPWRDNGEQLVIKPRIKVELFPSYKPDSSGNPVSNSLFQNEDEVEKPVSNIFEYTF